LGSSQEKPLISFVSNVNGHTRSPR
jgi:hypothetical protein